ncbi:MAG: hypothetical protein ACRD3V_18165 [Vicinamibacteria bacterium]
MKELDDQDQIIDRGKRLSERLGAALDSPVMGSVQWRDGQFCESLVLSYEEVEKILARVE